MKKSEKVIESSTKARRPARTVEGEEKRLISLATELAEKQLREGTASSQVITHFLKLGSSNAKLEREKMKREVEVLAAKAESLKSAKNSEELYKKAIDAMRLYSGGPIEVEGNEEIVFRDGEF